MTEILTAAQMRALEQAAIDSGEVTGLDLMERAGAGVVEAVMVEWPELALSSYKAVVLCGPGNNGGDGFVIARLLKQRGWEVEVFLYGDPEKLPPDAKVNYERWRDLGEVLSFTSYSERKTWACSLLVDALFGTGLTRAAPELGELFWNMEDMVDCFAVEPDHPLGRPAIVAVDIPSGVCADSGRDFEIEEHWWRASATAHLTVSFHRAKLGHYLFDGPQKCGKLVLADIGLSQGRPAEQDCEVNVVQPIHKSWLDKSTDTHKYTHGHALILSGLSGKTGAARLAARAALRVGAGLVTLGVPYEALPEVSAQITALMLTEIDTPEILTRVLTDERLNALCIGPGFGVERAGDFLPHVLAAKRATVLDADALTALAQSETAFANLHNKCVLTPHAGEFKRLFPDIAAKLAAPATKGPAYSKVDATRAAAERAGCVVLFKGPDTVIASPDGRCAINAAVYDRAAPWLATAGSGDVLAGLITGLMARGFAPHHACETAAYLHVEAARSFGPGLIAEDLPEELPKVFRQLGL